MKRIYVGFLSAFFGLAAFAAATRAQELDQIIVNVPYDFVVSGKTLPAGAYRVKRANDHDNHVLAITSLENGGGVLLLSSVVSPTREEKPALGFEVVNNKRAPSSDFDDGAFCFLRESIHQARAAARSSF